MNRGGKFYAKNTEMNRSCGIRAGDRGFIATDLAYATGRLYPKQFPDSFRL